MTNTQIVPVDNLPTKEDVKNVIIWMKQKYRKETIYVVV